MVVEVLALFDPTQVQHWLIAGGYFALLGVLLACGLGLPLPEDIPLILSGALIASGHMTWIGAGLVAWTGIMGGDMILYHLGRQYGHNITRVPYVGRHVTEERLNRVEVLFAKYGIRVVAVGRMFAGIRAAMVVTAGTIRYHRGKFLLADGLAAIVSGGAFMVLGYFLGKNLPKLLAAVEHGKLWVMGGALVVAAGVGTWMYFHSRRRVRAKQTSAGQELA